MKGALLLVLVMVVAGATPMMAGSAEREVIGHYLWLAGGSSVYLSDDEGRTWRGVSTGLPERTDISAIVAMPGSQPTAVAAVSLGTGGDSAVFRFAEGAWQPCEAAPTEWIRQLLRAWHPGGAASLYAVAGGDLWRTADGGKTWRSRPLPDEEAGIAGGFDGKRELIYARAEKGLYLSIDMIGPWMRRDSGLPLEKEGMVTAVADNPVHVYAVTDEREVYETRSGGLRWRLAAWRPSRSEFTDVPTICGMVAVGPLPATVFVHGGGYINPMATGWDCLLRGRGSTWEVVSRGLKSFDLCPVHPATLWYVCSNETWDPDRSPEWKPEYRLFRVSPAATGGPVEVGPVPAAESYSLSVACRLP